MPAFFMPEDRPKIRPLDILPVVAQGRQAFLLRDAERFSDQELVLPAEMVYLLSQLDGTHTIREAQVSFVRRFGLLLTSDKIEDLLRRLDEALLLDSDRFRAFRTQLEAEFRARPTRPAAHAGRSYEEGAAAFTLAWQRLLESAALPDDFALDVHRPALIAPHYDMHAAAPCYAAAYALLARAPRPEVVIVLGIAHSGDTTPFILTRKLFETPFGALETDPEITAKLVSAAPFDPLADEFVHRGEHSIEFQAALLHFLYREGEPPRIVPILCGGFHRQAGQLVDPGQSSAADEFLSLLRGLLDHDPRPIAVIAAADLSHVGARFGQPPVTQARLELARRHDMALLEKAQAGNAAGLHEVLAREGDRYNVCGFPAIYALLRLLSVREGRLLHYQQAVEPQTQSCVSFASVALR